MKDIMKEVELDTKIILDLILKYPNDEDLGRKIRSYYLEKIEEKTAKTPNND